ncbi:MAG: UDP-N-acetylmuramate dehydrogenase [Chitinophagaceae bacterium]|nr:MAG: UDP-N-acetylmuramate dehydrogenase [Chitinophagaceae bacterium]
MQIRENISLKRYNTFGIEAKAKYFAEFTTISELKQLLSERKIKEQATKLVLGGGSNILLTKNVDGAVLKNEIKGIDLVKEDEQHFYVRAGAGEAWHGLVLHCVEKGFAGMENLSLIPGNTGASPMQNIGAYGVEIKDVFHELEAYHLFDKTVVRFGTNDCEFGYRESIFKRKFKGQFIITSVTFRLDKNPTLHTSYGAIQQELEAMGVLEPTIKTISQAVINIRSSKLPNPKMVGNAGSFFKNPMVAKPHADMLMKTYSTMPTFPVDETQVKVPAGWLIEQCGWKGYRKGDAGCYPKQALVLVNYGQATGNEVYALSEEILQSVKAKFSIVLEREVNII